MGIISTTKLRVLADYFFIWLQSDHDKDTHLPTFSNEEMDAMCSLGEHTIYMFTERNMDVDFSISVLDQIPEIEPNSFDHLVECNINCSTGSLIINNAIDQPDSLYIQTLPKGNYQVYLGYKNLESISEDHFDGNDMYEVYLWQNEARTTQKILKHR